MSYWRACKNCGYVDLRTYANPFANTAAHPYAFTNASAYSIRIPVPIGLVWYCSKLYIANANSGTNRNAHSTPCAK